MSQNKVSDIICQLGAHAMQCGFQIVGFYHSIILSGSGTSLFPLRKHMSCRLLLGNGSFGRIGYDSIEEIEEDKFFYIRIYHI